jgi:hypothetical protein
MHPQLRAVVERIEPAETRELVAGVFDDLRRLLGYLDSVQSLTDSGATPDDAYFIFEALRCEALAAAGGLDYFCACQPAPTELSEELERMSFAVRHELKTVFERILPGALAAAPGKAASNLKDARDLLRNCFEQSTVSLARLYRPEVDAAELFEDIRARRDNSLRLYEDLEALLRGALYAEWHEGPEALTLFNTRLEIFREGSMEHLMEKDRETCEGFIDGLAAPHTRKSARLHLHRFACYLEILLKHVSMRSVLAESAAMTVAA